MDEFEKENYMLMLLAKLEILYPDTPEMVNDQKKEEGNRIFNQENVPFGLYRVWWKSGGSSLASIGGLYNGDRWIAPTNWTAKENPVGKLKDYTDDIIRLDYLDHDNFDWDDWRKFRMACSYANERGECDEPRNTSDCNPWCPLEMVSKGQAKVKEYLRTPEGRKKLAKRMSEYTGIDYDLCIDSISLVSQGLLVLMEESPDVTIDENPDGSYTCPDCGEKLVGFEDNDYYCKACLENAVNEDATTSERYCENCG